MYQRAIGVNILARNDNNGLGGDAAVNIQGSFWDHGIHFDINSKGETAMKVDGTWDVGVNLNGNIILHFLSIFRRPLTAQCSSLTIYTTLCMRFHNESFTGNSLHMAGGRLVLYTDEMGEEVALRYDALHKRVVIMQGKDTLLWEARAP